MAADEAGLAWWCCASHAEGCGERPGTTLLSRAEFEVALGEYLLHRDALRLLAAMGPPDP